MFARETAISKVENGPPGLGVTRKFISLYNPVTNESADHCAPKQWEQWRFPIVAASRLSATKTIGLTKIAQLAAHVAFGGLSAAVENMWEALWAGPLPHGKAEVWQRAACAPAESARAIAVRSCSLSLSLENGRRSLRPGGACALFARGRIGLVRRAPGSAACG